MYTKRFFIEFLMFVSTTRLKLHANQVFTYTNELVAYTKIPYTLAIKSLRCAKDTCALVSKITAISQIYSKILHAFHPLKVLHIPIYSLKSIRALSLVFTAHNKESRVFAVWKVYTSFKKLTSGISALTSFLEEFARISPVYGSLLQTASLVFLPITMVGAAVCAYKTVQYGRLFFEYSRYFKSEKETQNSVNQNMILRACQYIKSQESRLCTLKVCTRKNGLQQRVDALCMRIQKSQEIPFEVQKEAAELFHAIRNRIKHQLVHEACHTAVKVASSAATILLACNLISALPLAILEVLCAVGSLGTYLYAKHIPLARASASCCPFAALFQKISFYTQSTYTQTR